MIDYNKFNKRFTALLRDNIEQGTAPTPQLIRRIYDEWRPMADQEEAEWMWYLGPGDPILTENDEKRSELNVNNKIPHYINKRIVDGKCGYVYGNPQQVKVRDDDDGTERLRDWRKKYGLDDMDYENGKLASNNGYSARLLYYADDGESKEPAPRIIEPWACFLFGDIVEPIAAMRWWDDYEVRGDQLNDVVRVRYYDSKNIYEYTLNGGGGETMNADIVKHGFDSCPVVGYPNNNELLSDWENGKEKIKEYSHVVSDVSSELEQMRLAYLVFQDIYFEDEDRIREFASNMRKSAVSKVDSISDKQGSVYFLEKNLNDTVIQNHKEGLLTDINQDCGHVDWSDEFFGGNMSGVAISYKLIPLENKAIVAEGKHKRSDLVMYRKLFAAWQRLYRVKINWIDVEQIWVRNMPHNEKERLEIEQLNSTNDATIMQAVQAAKNARVPNAQIVKMLKRVSVFSDYEDDDLEAVALAMDSIDLREEFTL